jgi:hypothetical protein
MAERYCAPAFRFSGSKGTMVSVTDYPGKSGILGSHDAAPARPKKSRFRLFKALAAPFKDVDERAMHKKRPHGPVRNNSKGNVFPTRAATSAKAPGDVAVRRFPRSGD